MWSAVGPVNSDPNGAVGVGTFVSSSHVGVAKHALCKVSCVGAFLATSYYGLRFLTSTYWYKQKTQYAKTCIVNKLKRAPKLNPEIVRSNFNDTVMPTFKPASDHTHGVAAADRSAASSFIDRFANIIGLSAFFVQSSRADERNGRLGSRTYFWTKDIPAVPRPLDLPANPLIAMVDVDQYIDMPEFLCINVDPTIIYTVQPDQVSKVTNNYSYTFDERNQIRYNVTGGAIYAHHVWNYGTDHLVTYRTFLGIPYSLASYLVDRRSTSPDHELIMLTPLGSWTWFGAILYKAWISGRELQRLQVVTDTGFTRLMSSSASGVRVSTGRPGAYASATVPAAIDDTVASIARTSDYVLSLPQVLSFVDGDRIAACSLLEYHRKMVPHKADVVCPVPTSVRRYQFDPVSYQPEAKPTLVGFMNPLVHGAFAPDKCLANEVQSIKGRVLDVKQAELSLGSFMVRAMNEFAEMIVPEIAKHKLDPANDDTVLDRQNRPTQRRLFASAHGMLPKRIIRMFLKAEAYANVKDPRAISIVNPVDKRSYSRYMYAFETVLKSQPWYAFSRTPKDIAARVSEILRAASTAANTDFSRFDGHGSNIMRDLEKQILMRAFRPEHHEELLQLHRAQFNLKAVATFGTWYETGYSRASGSPETSLFNTLVNAFVAYLALRMTRIDGLFLSPHEAFTRLGIYGGDDGLTADIDARTYCKAASWIGQQLTIEPVQRGCLGIKFLARIYSPDVWFGDVNSCCDIPRQLVKLHTSVRMPSNVTPSMKLLEKVRSFSLSDLQTPIIGDFCKTTLRVVGVEIKEDPLTAPMRSWLSHYSKDNQYPNFQADWMVGYVEQALPTFEYKRFVQWCISVRTLDHILSPPMFMGPIPAKSEIPVVIDGEVLPHGVQFSAALAEQLASQPIDIKVNIQGSGTLPGAKPNGVAGDSKISIDTEQKKPNGVGHKGINHESFEDMKARKIQAGTWVEHKDEKKGVKPKGKPLTDKQLAFETMKAKKIKEGTWQERPSVKQPKLKTAPIDSWRKV